MWRAEFLFKRGDAAEEQGDYATARACFERAAAMGDSSALTRLAYLFDVGLGMPPDKTKAMQLYRRAWRIDRSSIAANNIAILYREQGDRGATFRWFRRCAEAGCGDAHLELAKCYSEGVGVRRSLEFALRSLASAIADPDIFDDTREQAKKMLATLRPRLVGGQEPK